MKSAARRHNVTGIPGLSIGTTKNDRGHVLMRYCVNYKEVDKPASASFYFGENKSQAAAFAEACEFMRAMGLTDLADAKLKRIYKDHRHESLL